MVALASPETVEVAERYFTIASSRAASTSQKLAATKALDSLKSNPEVAAFLREQRTRRHARSADRMRLRLARRAASAAVAGGIVVSARACPACGAAPGTAHGAHGGAGGAEGVERCGPGVCTHGTHPADLFAEGDGVVGGRPHAATCLCGACPAVGFDGAVVVEGESGIVAALPAAALAAAGAPAPPATPTIVAPPGGDNEVPVTRKIGGGGEGEMLLQRSVRNPADSARSVVASPAVFPHPPNRGTQAWVDRFAVLCRYCYLGKGSCRCGG